MLSIGADRRNDLARRCSTRHRYLPANIDHSPFTDLFTTTGMFSSLLQYYVSPAGAQIAARHEAGQGHLSLRVLICATGQQAALCPSARGNTF